MLLLHHNTQLAHLVYPPVKLADCIVAHTDASSIGYFYPNLSMPTNGNVTVLQHITPQNQRHPFHQTVAPIRSDIDAHGVNRAQERTEFGDFETVGVVLPSCNSTS